MNLKLMLEQNINKILSWCIFTNVDSDFNHTMMLSLNFTFTMNIKLNLNANLTLKIKP